MRKKITIKLALKRPWYYYGRLSHYGPRPIGGVPSVGVFLRHPSLYLREFRRKPRKTPNGLVDKRDQGLNLAPPVFQFWGALKRVIVTTRDTTNISSKLLSNDLNRNHLPNNRIESLNHLQESDKKYGKLLILYILLSTFTSFWLIFLGFGNMKSIFILIFFNRKNCHESI